MIPSGQIDPRNPVPVAILEHGACRHQPQDLFFEPIRSTTTGRMEFGRIDPLPAKQICATCSVRDECLAYALENELYGIWGGRTADERKRMRRRAGVNISGRRRVP